MRKLLATLIISSWATVAYAQKADLIVMNAKIMTLDSASTIAQALAVREGVGHPGPVDGRLRAGAQSRHDIVAAHLGE